MSEHNSNDLSEFQYAFRRIDNILMRYCIKEGILKLDPKTGKLIESEDFNKRKR
jgi:hypothetical protein